MAIFDILCAHGCGTKVGTVEFEKDKIPLDLQRRISGYYVTGHEPRIAPPPTQEEALQAFKSKLGVAPITASNLDELIDILRKG